MTVSQRRLPFLFREPNRQPLPDFIGSGDDISLNLGLRCGPSCPATSKTTRHARVPTVSVCTEVYDDHEDDRPEYGPLHQAYLMIARSPIGPTVAYGQTRFLTRTRTQPSHFLQSTLQSKMKTLRPLSSTPMLAGLHKSAPSCRAAYISQIRNPSLTQRRAFVPNPFGGTQSLVASRTLPYPSRLVYETITDVASYQHFIPYCIGSEVTKYSNPTADGRRWPEEAKLLIGFNNDVSEVFWSRVYCVPDTVVETVAGSSETTLRSGDIEHHGDRPPPDQDPARNGNVMKTLATRWTLRPFHYKPPPVSATSPDSTHMNHKETSPLPGQDRTEVNLSIQYEFANPMYGVLSSAASSKVAEKMIEAFEKRVKSVIEGPAMAHEKSKSIDGVLKS